MDSFGTLLQVIGFIIAAVGVFILLAVASEEGSSFAHAMNPAYLLFWIARHFQKAIAPLIMIAAGVGMMYWGSQIRTTAVGAPAAAVINSPARDARLS